MEHSQKKEESHSFRAMENLNTNYSLMKSEMNKAYEERGKVFEKYSYNEQKQYIKFAFRSTSQYFKQTILKQTLVSACFKLKLM
jgi:hypothetical protein